MVKSKVLTEIGWREEIRIPEIASMPIKVKVDTGARTSALHATDLEFSKRGQTKYVEFKVHPNQDSSKPVYKTKQKILEFRNVKSSTGETTRRPVVMLELKLGDVSFETEVTLVNRDLMGFRMLLGRKALSGRFVVNVAKSFIVKQKGKARK